MTPKYLNNFGFICIWISFLGDHWSRQLLFQLTSIFIRLLWAVTPPSSANSNRHDYNDDRRSNSFECSCHEFAQIMLISRNYKPQSDFLYCFICCCCVSVAANFRYLHIRMVWCSGLAKKSNSKYEKVLILIVSKFLVQWTLFYCVACHIMQPPIVDYLWSLWRNSIKWFTFNWIKEGANENIITNQSSSLSVDVDGNRWAFLQVPIRVVYLYFLTDTRTCSNCVKGRQIPVNP